MARLYSAVTKMKPSNSAILFCQRTAFWLAEGIQALEAASSKNGRSKSRRSTISASISGRALAFSRIHLAGMSPKRVGRVDEMMTAILSLDMAALLDNKQ